MKLLRYITFLILISAIGNSRPIPKLPKLEETKNPKHQASKGGLISTRFKSFEELKTVIHIEYFNNETHTSQKSFVRISHPSDGQMVHSIIEADISENDINKAKAGSLWDKISLGLGAPYLAYHRDDLMRVFLLGRRIGKKFGAGDVAFYDFAETMVEHIDSEQLVFIDSMDLTEKGYLNSFNHITAQALMTGIFSEKLADFVADLHERSNMPEIVKGNFSQEQLEDLKKGPVDNYVDVINNEWGQELGKVLQKKYALNRTTHWTPELLTDYMNDIQSYYSWAFQISFQPFKTTDDLIIKYATKINRVMNDATLLKY